MLLRRFIFYSWNKTSYIVEWISNACIGSITAVYLFSSIRFNKSPAISFPPALNFLRSVRQHQSWNHSERLALVPPELQAIICFDIQFSEALTGVVRPRQNVSVCRRDFQAICIWEVIYVMFNMSFIISIALQLFCLKIHAVSHIFPFVYVRNRAGDFIYIKNHPLLIKTWECFKNNTVVLKVLISFYQECMALMYFWNI